MVERRECKVCGGWYAQILDHIRKEHNYEVSDGQAMEMGLHRCGCGAVVASGKAIKAHQARMKEQCSVWVREQEAAENNTVESDEQVEEREIVEDDNLLDRFVKLVGVPGVNKPLSGQWGASFRKVASRLASTYMEEPTELNLYHILALPKRGLAPCLAQAAHGNRKARSILESYPLSEAPIGHRQQWDSQPSQYQQVQRYVEQGRLGTAARILGSDSKVLPLTDEVIDSLEEKHPVGEPEPFSRWEGDAPGLMPDDDLPATLLRQFKSDTAAGISGWTQPLTTQAFKDIQFRSFFNLLVKQVIQNKAPGKQMLCTSRLTPLAKPGGGVRPIAVGELFYRLIMKCIMRTYYYRSALHPYQLGVGSAGGVEPIAHCMELFTSEDQTTFTHVTSLDFSNAFNTIKRYTLASSLRKHLRSLYRPCKWAYGESTPLVVSDGTSLVKLESSQGVRQGDPLGPLLFSLGIKDILGGLQEFFGEGALILAYLDDVIILSQGDVLDDVEEYFNAQENGLKLNRSKCRVQTKQDVVDNGISLVGTVVGAKDARVQFLREKTSVTLSKLDRLNGLPSQHAFLLLTRCIQHDLRHLQRTLYMEDASEEWDVLDNGLWNALRSLRGSPRTLPWDEWIFSLPTNLGGLGIPSHRELAPFAHAAMADTAEQTLKPLYDSDNMEVEVVKSQRERCAVHYDDSYHQLLNSLTPYQQNMMVDNSSKLGRKWLTTIPFNKALALSDSEVSVALHLRTLCPGQVDHCIHCGLSNITGHDDVCNSRPNRRLARHDHIKRLLVKHIHMAPNSSVSVEPMVKDSHLRTDFRVAGPASFIGGQSEYDLTIVAPTSGPLTSTQDTFKDSLGRMEREKSNKYKNITYTPFHPIVLSLGGTLSHGTEQVFKHWRSKVPQWDLLIRLISIGLIRARSTYFDL